MNLDLLVSLFANLALVAVLFMFAKWFIKYDIAWWLRFQRNKKAYSIMADFVFLKIRLPREVFKTPASMEVVLLTLNQALGHYPMPVIPKVSFTPFYKEKEDHGQKKKVFSFRLFTYFDNDGNATQRHKWIDSIKENFYFKYLQGSLRAWSSIEIVSDEGEIYFLLATKRNTTEIFKQSCYSQFPGVEIEELAEDPLNKFHYTNQKTGHTQIYVGRYGTPKSKEALPIKTYVDYGLDKDMVKDEYKIDPLVVLLESMAQAKKGEMYWFQILIRPTIFNKKDDKSHEPFDWIKETQDAIDKILMKVPVKEPDGKGGFQEIKDKFEYKRGMVGLSPIEKMKVEAMQRNIEKPGFDCVIRMFYWVDKRINPKGLDVAKGVMTVVNATKPFAKPEFNDIKFGTITTDSDTPFLDPTGVWTEGKRTAFWKLSKLRAAFYQEAPGAEFAWKFFPLIWKRWRETGNWDSVEGIIGEIKEYWGEVGHIPSKGDDGRSKDCGSILNLEEIATLWHFPSKNFANSESKVSAVKADPPSNLPI